MGKRKRSSCQQDNHNDSLASKIMRTRIPDLPEDIWSHVHSLMPMRDAGRAACLSRAFLRSWRRHPNLIFNKDTIGMKKNLYGENFHHKISRILRNHSGISLKAFKLDYSGMCGFDGTSYLDSWLQAALNPGIEEVTLWLFHTRRIYEFPCSLLSDGVRNSLRYLKLRCCALRPTVELAPMRSLTSLHLSFVSIKWDGLKRLLSNSLALEELELVCCDKIVCLKIPSALQRLNSLNIYGCSPLKVLESKAPNLSSLSLLHFGGRLVFSRVKTLQMKKLITESTVYDARTRLPSIMPNLETLVINSFDWVVDAPMLPTKFLCLKHLTVRLSSGTTITQAFDYFSLVSFLDASPSLETFILNVSGKGMIHESISAHPQLRHTPEHHHGHLRSVKICGFSSEKSLFELTRYILENAVSLKFLTLDTFYGDRCGQGKCTSCLPTPDVFMDVSKAISGIKTYIENKVPSTVKLTVLEPCSRCHVRRVI
uniref:F-box domain containing protein n=1 Tax=Zea mays TaxID=4577 RepID=B6U9Q3_MAIZE|nr:F-box domain containing protein [Zea mays]|eukprot:NP_001152152.1 F-box domain containing protein [Zea mays]